ncbi:MAG: hypothetical protein ACYC8T_08845 [Myxococcaceae bacterium]
MRAIRFAFEPRPDLANALEILPLIDDRALTDLVHTFERERSMEPPEAYGGLIPSYFRFGPMHEHFLGVGPAGRGVGKVPLLGCSCGEWGCWPLLARIVRAHETVVWTEFEQPFRKERDYSGFGPFEFGRQQYEQALEELRTAVDVR